MLFPESHVIPIYGIPGSGKTTYLLDVVNMLFARGVKPHEIAFVSYTTNACDEARDRALVKFNLKRRDFRYFQTIHALAKRTYTAERGVSMPVVENDDIQPIANRWNMPVKQNHDASAIWKATGAQQNGNGDYVLGIKSLAFARQTTIEEILKDREIMQELRSYRRLPLNRVYGFLEDYADMKKANGKIDFDDMLAGGMQVSPLDIRYVIIDEAQDLSLAQWQVCANLFMFAERVWIAGDDDQAIYDFGGGNSKTFRDMGTELDSTVILDKSWRCPKVVLASAQGPLKLLEERISKTVTPRDATGVAERISLDSIPFEEGEWLCLIRQHNHIDPFVEFFDRRGFAYVRPSGAPSISLAYKRLIATHQKILKHDAPLKPLEVKRYFSQLEVGVTIKRGFKHTIEKKLAGKGIVEITADELVADYGLLPDVFGLDWFDALTEIPENKMNYLRTTIANGEFYNDNPRIKISTIHGAKGSECDNVVINPQISFRQKKSLEAGKDDEFRVAYVAMTRAKERLYIMTYPQQRVSDTLKHYTFFLQKSLDEDQAA